MSYQEYAQLGRRSRRNSELAPISRRSADAVDRLYPDRQYPDRLHPDRQYTPSTASFSVPRRSVQHSTTSSTSSASLSPSNSASQKGGVRRSAIAEKPARSSLARPKPPERKPSHSHHRHSAPAVSLPWRPFLLQRRVLASFVSVLAGLVIALEALAELSSRSGTGLGPVGSTPARYLWACGPPALLTLLAALWARVEYQAASSAPWLRMARGPASADKTLLLDYVSMPRPRALVRAIANGDAIVACAVAVSLILGTMVVLSTALVAPGVLLGGAEQSRTVPVTLHTAFADDPARLATAPAPMAFSAMLAMQQDGLPLPDGASAAFAYQRFSASLPASASLGATVDGFSAGLDCDPATLNVTAVDYDGANVRFGTTLDMPGCSVTVPIQSTRFFRETDTSSANSPRNFARFVSSACDGSGGDQDEDMRVAVVFGSATLDAASVPADAPPAGTRVPVNGSISRSAQLLCRPTYTVSRVDVRRNATDLLAIGFADPPRNRTLDRVRPWDVAAAVFASFDGDLAAAVNDTTPSFYLPDVLDVDPPMYLALGMQRSSPPLAPTSDFFDDTRLRTLASGFFSQYTALLASSALTEPASAAATGTVAEPSERLLVRGVAVHLLAALAAVAMFLTVAAAWFAPRAGFLPRSPGTIIDTAVLVGHSRPLLQALRGGGGASIGELHAHLAGDEYHIGVEPYDRGSTSGGYFKILGTPHAHESGAPAERRGRDGDSFITPVALHPASRVVAIVLLLGAVAGLEVSLRRSQATGGFGVVGSENDNLHLAWTALPVLVFALAAAYFGLAAFFARALAPFAALRRGGSSFEGSVNLDYLDRPAVVVLYRAARSRDFAVVAASAALLLSSLLAIFAAPLFSTVASAPAAPISLVSPDPFTDARGSSLQPCDGCRDGPMVASLVLSGNMSYPPFTFEDLNLPPLTVGSAAVPDDAVISATVPAIRPAMACSMFAAADIAANLTTSYILDGKANPLRIDLPGEPGPGSSEADSSTFTLATASSGTISRDALFGATRYRQIQSADASTATPHWIYVWGQLSDAGTNTTTVKAISAMACNETAERVSTAATLFGSALAITGANPPVVDPAASPQPAPAIPLLSANETDSSNSSFYDQLVSLPTPHLVDRFFATLLASRYAVPGAALADAASPVARRVAAAIVDQHKIIRTQVLRDLARQPRKTTGDAATADAAAPSGIYNGTLTTAATAGRRRAVAQDAVATRILQALLGATTVLAAVGWVFSAGAASAHPRAASGLCSVASTAALLADGNTFGLLGRTAEWQATERLRALFMDGLHVTMRFRLAWEAPRRRRREETLASWGMEGASSRSGRRAAGELFGISAVRTGGWGGGESVGLGLQARVGYGHRKHVRDWGWT